MTFGQKYNLDKVKRKMIFEKTVFYDILYLSYIIHSCAVNNSGLKKSDSRKHIAAPIIGHNLSVELLLPTKGSVLHMIQLAKERHSIITRGA